MILGTGVDIVEYEKIEKAITRSNGKFISRVFTQYERNICEQRNHSISCYCSRFAAKEALVKAYKVGILRAGIKNIEVRNHKDGSPYYVLYGHMRDFVSQQHHLLHLSLSDSEQCAIAFATVEEIN